MRFGHEKLDVYRVSLEYVSWAFKLCKRLNGLQRPARAQLLRASQGIPLNMAEGNGKGTPGDRRRFFEMARGSALECAAIQDVLEVCEALSREENGIGKTMLDRIVAMLTKLGRHGYSVREDSNSFGVLGLGFDSDADSDNDADADSDNDADSDSDSDSDSDADNESANEVPCGMVERPQRRDTNCRRFSEPAGLSMDGERR